MNPRYMLAHKLHFVTVNTAKCSTMPFNVNIDNKYPNPTILFGENILKHIKINQLDDSLDWHYWSRSNLHRYVNINTSMLTHNIAQQFNILNTPNAILALNFNDDNILPHNLAQISNSELKTYTETAVIASFKNMPADDYLNNRAEICLFEPNYYNPALGNIPKHFKQGTCLRNYLQICKKYQNGIYNSTAELNNEIDNLNSNNFNSSTSINPIEMSIDFLEKSYRNKSYQIKQQILTESLLDYEGSTGIDFIKLFNSGILPQEMVYFSQNNQIIYVNNNTTPLCTYAIIEQAHSNKWTANGGIALHLQKYLDSRQKLDITAFPILNP